MNEIYLYGTIGQDYWDEDATTAKDFCQQLSAFAPDDEVHIHVNSPGGSFHDGAAIYSAIQQHAGRTVAHIDGLAASAASFCIMSADEVLMSPAANVMIHRASGSVRGNAEDLRAVADTLDMLDQQLVDLYTAKSGKAEDEVRAMLEAETWMNAAQALEAGFIDAIEQDAPKMAAMVDPKVFARYKHAPSLEPADCNAPKTIDGEGDGDAPSATGTAFTRVGNRICEIGSNK